MGTEIDRVMKKVDEGVDWFDEIWEKVYSAEQQNQKEKYEIDLKKEIKKLQRLRDQIKTWIGSSDVKDKDSLIHARRLIETKMEQFKVCEKETKTKTYSKEGLARAEKLTPEEQGKLDTCNWVKTIIENLQQLVEERDVEIERLSAGKGKKTNKNVIEEYSEIMASHKYHINKLEGIMRLVMNDRLDAEPVNDLKDDLDYYLEAHDEDEYVQGYDEEMFYETLGLDEMDVVNVDRVTQAPSVSKPFKNDDASETSGSVKEKKSKVKKVSPANGIIPMTIGRARPGKSKDEVKEVASPSKKTSSVGPSALGPTPTVPVSRPPPVVNANGGASMAAILKRESEQQEREKQKQAAVQQAAQQRLLQEQQARAQAEQLRQQQMQMQQQEQLRQQETLRQQQAAVQQQKAQQEAMQRQQQQKIQERQRQQHVAQQEAAVKQQQLQQQQVAQQQQAVQQQLQQTRSQPNSQGNVGPIDNLISSGLGGLSLGNVDSNASNGSPTATISPQQQSNAGAAGAIMSSVNYDATASYLGALNDSFLHCPSNADSERQRTYTPRNPYPTPSSYPSTPSTIFEQSVIFEKLGADCLFFIFYYAQGSYQQYLAARELKKRSWRYHKKYMTWFQRHEEPKVTTEEYEQGTYVYFDYETGWCQRIKSDFRFEYSFLEDSLSI